MHNRSHSPADVCVFLGQVCSGIIITSIRIVIVLPASCVYSKRTMLSFCFVIQEQGLKIVNLRGGALRKIVLLIFQPTLLHNDQCENVCTHSHIHEETYMSVFSFVE